MEQLIHGEYKKGIWILTGEEGEFTCADYQDVGMDEQVVEHDSNLQDCFGGEALKAKERHGPGSTSQSFKGTRQQPGQVLARF